MSCTIALAHTLTPSHTVRCLDRDTDVYLYFTKLLRLRHFRIFRLQKPTVLTKGSDGGFHGYCRVTTKRAADKAIKPRVTPAVAEACIASPAASLRCRGQ